MVYDGKGEIKRSPEKIENMEDMGESGRSGGEGDGKRGGEHEGIGWLS